VKRNERTNRKFVSVQSVNVYGCIVGISKFIDNIVWVLLQVKNDNNINKYFKLRLFDTQENLACLCSGFLQGERIGTEIQY